MKATIYVTLKKSIADPKGQAVREALHSLSYEEVKEVRIGKRIDISLDDTNKENAKARIEEMCQKLLANTVIEQYDFEIVEEEKALP